MPLTLTKLLNEADYSEAGLYGQIAHLNTARRHLGPVLADALPTEHRLWEYGQGLQATYHSYEWPEMNKLRVLEVGGGSSLFLPAILSWGDKGRFVSVESPAWVSANWAHWKAQTEYTKSAGQEVELATAAPEGEVFDFIACISVIENLDWDKTRVAEHKDPISGAVWHSGHTFMQEWIRANLLAKLAPGGVCFITSDIGEDKEAQGVEDPYMFSWMRPPGIWCPANWRRLVEGLAQGDIAVVGGEPDYTWNGVAYSGYSFASAAFKRSE